MKKLLSALAIIMVVLFAECKKDTYVPLSTVCPVVISTDPTNMAVNVPLNQVISATFNEKMDPATIGQASFTLTGTANVPGALTYNESDNTLRFVPAGLLAVNTTYTATVLANIKDTYGNALQVNYVWTFSTGATLTPVVISTDPTNAANGVVLNKIINATFNMPMDPSTINGTTFIIKQGNTAVTGSISYNGSMASFAPSANLIANTTYTGTITTGAKNVAGMPLAAKYVWTFTTGTNVGPTVIATDPANNATGVLLNKIVTATFSVAMDPTTLTTTTFMLKQGTISVPGTVSYSGSTASFTPSANLLPGTLYTATVTTGAKSPSGTPLANNYVWTFTTSGIAPPTVISTDPANNATGVASNKIITATFSTVMDPLTITSSTFLLNLGTSSVAGTVSYSGSTATFTPSASLLADTTYTATITTGARNVTGTPLANNYVWTFKTGMHTGPLAPNLKSVARFGIIAGVGVANAAGFSVINNMDVGIYPGTRSSVTGFPPAKINNGAIYASDDATPPGTAAMLKQAKLDLVAAYNYAAGASNPAPATVSGDQGGKTLYPGIYKSTSTLEIMNGDLTLDAKGDPNAVWIFQVASAFTTVGGSGGNVILTNGAQAANVYWQVASSATIGSYTSFYGNILAYTSITMDAYATATGRMLAINASVVMTSTNTINKP